MVYKKKNKHSLQPHPQKMSSTNSVPNVPNVPEGGNTSTPSVTSKKAVSPAKKWCFTINNYTEEHCKMLRLSDCSIVPKIMFQSERGEEGTCHLQGWLEFATKKRPMSIFKTTQIHWEKMKGTIKENIDYCGKTDTYTGEVRFSRGADFPYHGPQIVLRPWQEKVVEILRDKPCDRSIYWVWSHKGNMGKSTFAKYIFHNIPDAIVTGGKASDMKNGVQTYINTNHKFPKVVIVDIPRVNRGHFSISGIEEIKNMFFFSGKYEGGMVSGPKPHVICFANCEPNYSEMSEDRWQMMDLEGRHEFQRAFIPVDEVVPQREITYL